MKFVFWFAGILATIAALRFVIEVFKRITSKQNMSSLLDRAEDGIKNTAEKTANFIKEKRKEKKNEPVVTIR